MRTHKTRTASDRMALLAIVALVVPLVACDNPVAPDPVIRGDSNQAQVASRLSTAFAAAGERVRLEIPLSGGLYAHLRADVSWDPDLFAFSHAIPGEAADYLLGNPDDGWLEIDSRLDSPRGELGIVLVFVARVAAETSSIRAEGTLHSDREDDLIVY